VQIDHHDFANNGDGDLNFLAIDGHSDSLPIVDPDDHVKAK
jgi:hypothetical protein